MSPEEVPIDKDKVMYPVVNVLLGGKEEGTVVICEDLAKDDGLTGATFPLHCPAGP